MSSSPMGSGGGGAGRKEEGMRGSKISGILGGGGDGARGDGTGGSGEGRKPCCWRKTVPAAEDPPALLAPGPGGGVVSTTTEALEEYADSLLTASKALTLKYQVVSSVRAEL